jgi:hypothetical protein
VCSMAADDKSAWTEIALKQPGLVLTRVVFSGIVRRDPSAPLVFKATTRAPTPVTSPKEVRDAVLAGVNEARANAGIAPLALAPKETAVSERLAAHFLSSETTGDHEVSDKVALGLLAGWDVEGGVIRSGGFYAGFSPGSDDANRFVEHALESPGGRHALLDPHARQIAIGAAPPGEFGGVGAVVTTYSFFEGNDPAAEAKKVLAHLATLRAQQGLAPPSPIAGLEGLASQARLVGGGRAEPMAALDQALNLEVARYRHALRGWVVATNDLDRVPLPPELVVPANVAVGIEVAHWKPEGAAWGSYVVFLVAPGDATPAPGTVAMR